MSLYGDLPPPVASTDGDSPAKKPAADAGTGASGSTKPALPAGWSSSITRFKPMLNRKLAPPKPKPAARAIPAGFVAQIPAPVAQSGAASVSSLSGTSVASSTSAIAVPGPVVSTLLPVQEKVVDESSWLKARIAQVQRQDVETVVNVRKQVKRTPVKGQPGPISLNDEYDIARPNDYEEFKGLFENDRKFREEEAQRAKEEGRAMGREIGHAHSRSRSRSRSPAHSYSRSRNRSRSRSRSYSRSISRSRSRSRSRTPSSSRERSRRRSHSSKGGSNPHRSHSHDYSRGSSKGHGFLAHAPSREQASSVSTHSRVMASRSRSPQFRKRHGSRSRSRSPSSGTSRRRSPSPQRRRVPLRSPSPPPPTHARTTTYKAFAPPPSLVADTQPVRASEAGWSTAASVTAPLAAALKNDTSGEDAFLRRAQLSQQRSMNAAAVAAPPRPPQPQPLSQHASPMPGQQIRTAFVPSTQQTASRGTPSNVILLTNMVGPGEVDDTLQEETAGECEKYGAVVRCLIFEVQNGKVPPEEAVRIFVKFGTVASADSALRDLDGRFFGGRQVHGRFFDERRFDLLQLAP